MPKYESHVTKKVTLGSNVATSDTFTVGYPAGYDESSFAEQGHKISVLNGQDLTSPEHFTVAFGADLATITYTGSSTLTSGSELYVEFNVKGSDGEVDVREFSGGRVGKLAAIVVNLGAPDAADADGIALSQTPASGGEQSLTLNGTTVASGVAVLDVPRNITVTSGGNDSGRTITVTGSDEYGSVMVEEITGANAGVASGKKAFKKVSSVQVDNDTAGTVTVGFGDVLGLPVYLDDASNIIVEQENGSAAGSAGTVVAGDNAKPTATTGDVRGTYDPNSASDGDKNFSLFVLLQNADNKGAGQFAG